MTESLPEPTEEQGRSEEGAEGQSLKQEVLQTLQPYVLPERAEEAANVVQALMIQQSHSGPLPSAKEFRGYEQALPGAANRLMEMAEREQLHRHSLEATIVSKEAGMKGKGQWFALIALMSMLALVGLIASWGHPIPAATLGTGVIIGVVALFLGQRPRQPAEPQEPNKPQ